MSASTTDDDDRIIATSATLRRLCRHQWFKASPSLADDVKQCLVDFKKSPAILKTIINSGNENGKTALHLASQLDKGHATVKYLLDSSGDINAVTTRGHTPLFLAASMGRCDTVRLLLRKGAKPNVRTASGLTAAVAAFRRLEPTLLYTLRSMEFAVKENDWVDFTQVSTAICAEARISAGEECESLDDKDNDEVECENIIHIRHVPSATTVHDELLNPDIEDVSTDILFESAVSFIKLVARPENCGSDDPKGLSIDDIVTSSSFLLASHVARIMSFKKSGLRTYIRELQHVMVESVSRVYSSQRDTGNVEWCIANWLIRIVNEKTLHLRFYNAGYLLKLATNMVNVIQGAAMMAFKSIPILIEAIYPEDLLIVPVAFTFMLTEVKTNSENMLKMKAHLCDVLLRAVDEPDFKTAGKIVRRLLGFRNEAEDERRIERTVKVYIDKVLKAGDICRATDMMSTSLVAPNQISLNGNDILSRLHLYASCQLQISLAREKTAKCTSKATQKVQHLLRKWNLKSDASNICAYEESSISHEPISTVPFNASKFIRNPLTIPTVELIGTSHVSKFGITERVFVKWVCTTDGLCQAQQELSKSHSFIGFDCEWKSPSAHCSLLQVASLESVWVIDTMARMHIGEYGRALLEFLCWLFKSNHVTRLGFGFSNDVKKIGNLISCLSRHPGIDFNIDMMEINEVHCALTNTQDLQPACLKILGLKQLPSLKLCIKSITGINFDKSEQQSDWNTRPLSDSQLRYAALDAWILLFVNFSIQEKHTCTPN